MNLHDIKIATRMLEHCKDIADGVNEVKTYEVFLTSKHIRDASIFRISQIGELSHTKLSDEFKNHLSQFPWKAIYSMRNRIIHGYDTLDLQIVWDIIVNDIPTLAYSLRREIENYYSNEKENINPIDKLKQMLGDTNK